MSWVDDFEFDTLQELKLHLHMLEEHEDVECLILMAEHKIKHIIYNTKSYHKGRLFSEQRKWG